MGLRRGAFTCVRWQVTLRDPIWQVTSRSCEMGVPLTATHDPFIFIYVAAKATYIRLLYGKRGFFGPISVKRGRTHIVLG